MALSKAQLYKYRAEWAKVRKLLREQYGRSPADADAERKRIHAKVGAVDCKGEPKSSLALTNREFDRVLAAFWAWTRDTDLASQLTQENQPGRRCRWVCLQALAAIYAVDPAKAPPPDQRDHYIDKLFARLNPQIASNPDYCEAGQWGRVIAAIEYQRGRVCGTPGKAHARRVHTTCSPAATPVCEDDGDPF